MIYRKPVLRPYVRESCLAHANVPDLNYEAI